MGCSGSKDDKAKEQQAEGTKPEDKIENADTPAGSQDDPNPTASHPSTANDKEQQSSGDDGQKKAKWASDELKSMMKDYFSRYDLDGSETINTSSELKQLCTNLVVKLELDMDVKTIDNHVNSAGDMSKLNWNFDSFMEWFMETFQPLTCWQPEDVSSSDDDAPGHLRSGTYNLEMADGVTMAFKIRYSDEAKTKLFERNACDGIHPDSKGTSQQDIPKDLHLISGSFDQDAKTCRFTKAYDVDCDPDTKEPVIEFEGKITSHTEIVGTWKNIEEDEAAIQMLAKMGLEGAGNFTMTKVARLD